MSIQTAVQWFGISRQAYYQAKKQAQTRLAEDGLILELVRAKRLRHPQMGVRKLHHELQSAMQMLGITRGRDAIFHLLRENDLLIGIKRSRSRTTRSGLWRCPNRLADLSLSRPLQAWVGDITYITTEAGFAYLALVMDAFSRFIVGFDLSTSLAAEGCLRALNKGIALAPDELDGLVHHSDHGVQYASWPYRQRLEKYGIISSMGEVGNCYENAMAERLNGILKGEYGLDDQFVSLQHAQQAVKEAVWLYNFERPHLALKYAKPAQIHLT